MAHDKRRSAVRLCSSLGSHSSAATLLAVSSLVPAAGAQIAVTPNLDHVGESCLSAPASVPNAQGVEASTVMLITIGIDGKRHGIDSGVVVRDSASPTDPHNAIVTVAHGLGIRKAWYEGVSVPTDHVLVVQSDGVLLGPAKPVLMGTRDVSASNVDDLAVLRMMQASPAYDAIPGVALAPVQARSGFLSGIISRPSGIVEGMSGGTVADHQGRLLGLVNRADHGNETVSLPLPRVYDAGHHALTGDPIELPAKTEMFAISLGNRKVLKELGRAGLGITQGNVAEQDVVVLGFGKGFCHVEEGRMAELDTRDRSRFLPDSLRDAPTFYPYWYDEHRSLKHVRTLLQDLRDDQPNAGDIDFWIDALRHKRNFAQANGLELSSALATYSEMAPNPLLRLMLDEAAAQVGAWGEQHRELKPEHPKLSAVRNRLMP